MQRPFLLQSRKTAAEGEVELKAVGLEVVLIKTVAEVKVVLVEMVAPAGAKVEVPVLPRMMLALLLLRLGLGPERLGVDRGNVLLRSLRAAPTQRLGRERRGQAAARGALRLGRERERRGQAAAAGGEAARRADVLHVGRGWVKPAAPPEATVASRVVVRCHETNTLFVVCSQNSARLGFYVYLIR